MQRAEVESQRIASTEGVDVALHHFGGSGRPLIICHATGFHGQAYAPLAEALIGSFTVMALDFRGHGSTAAPADGVFSWERMTNDLLAVVDAATDEPPLGVGHSMGGAAILLAQARRAGTFAGAYLFEPVVFPRDMTIPDGENTLSAGARNRRATFPSKRAAVERYGSRPPLDALRADALEAYVEFGFVETDSGEVTLACEPEHEAQTFESSDGAILEDLTDVKLDLIVGAGIETPGPADIAPVLAESIDGATFLHYDDLGHFGPLQAPDRIAADIVTAYGWEAQRPAETRSCSVRP